MKNLFVLISILFITRVPGAAQVNYCDFEGNKIIHFGQYTGVLDTMHVNYFPNVVDSSAKCGMYMRDTTLYNWMKIYPDTKMIDITPYASSAFNAPRMRMKVYTSAPVGSVIQIQLGIRSVDNYPAGIHSEYQATTMLQNAWHEVSFTYFQSTQNSLAMPDAIDKMVILFRPGVTTRDSMLFDDILGPPLANTLEVADLAGMPFQLHQNKPNPTGESTSISFSLSNKGHVSLVLYDVLGTPVRKLAEEEMTPGSHTLPVELAGVPNGVYFYVFTMNGISRSMRMIVNH